MAIFKVHVDSPKKLTFENQHHVFFFLYLCLLANSVFSTLAHNIIKYSFAAFLRMTCLLVCFVTEMQIECALCMGSLMWFLPLYCIFYTAYIKLFCIFLAVYTIHCIANCTSYIAFAYCVLRSDHCFICGITNVISAPILQCPGFGINFSAFVQMICNYQQVSVTNDNAWRWRQIFSSSSGTTMVNWFIMYHPEWATQIQ